MERILVELHIIQNFGPANLNRDDTGMPKECIFGGHPRARHLKPVPQACGEGGLCQPRSPPAGSPRGSHEETCNRACRTPRGRGQRPGHWPGRS